MSKALSKIRESGFNVGLEDGQLWVAPFSKLTAQQLDYLKAHKAEIIQALQSEPPINDGEPVNPLLVVAYTPLGEPIELIADDARHREWLLKMNPPPLLH